jgi:hypothetical protein
MFQAERLDGRQDANGSFALGAAVLPLKNLAIYTPIWTNLDEHLDSSFKLTHEMITNKENFYSMTSSSR